LAKTPVLVPGFFHLLLSRPLLIVLLLAIPASAEEIRGKVVLRG
jgi:hypothetical protein